MCVMSLRRWIKYTEFTECIRSWIQLQMYDSVTYNLSNAGLCIPFRFSPIPLHTEVRKHVLVIFHIFSIYYSTWLTKVMSERTFQIVAELSSLIFDTYYDLALCLISLKECKEIKKRKI